MLFDEVKVGARCFAKILKLGTFKLKILTSGKFFIDSRRAYFVAHGHLATMTLGIDPTFVPNPNIFAVVEEFSTMSCWNWTKNKTA